jgi:hypothetical protein
LLTPTPAFQIYLKYSRNERGSKGGEGRSTAEKMRRRLDNLGQTDILIE